MYDPFHSRTSSSVHVLIFQCRSRMALVSTQPRRASTLPVLPKRARRYWKFSVVRCVKYLTVNLKVKPRDLIESEIMLSGSITTMSTEELGGYLKIRFACSDSVRRRANSHAAEYGRRCHLMQTDRPSHSQYEAQPQPRFNTNDVEEMRSSACSCVQIVSQCRRSLVSVRMHRRT